MGMKRILVVEDEVIVAMTIEDTLTKLGYEVVGSVTNGPDAIQKAGETRPDLILMDIRLKGDMDGIEAAQRIEALYGLPVIYLTAHSDQATLSRAIATQPYGYLIKPFRERELYTNIEMALHKHRVLKKTREIAGERQKIASPVDQPAEPGLDKRLFDAIGLPLFVVDSAKRVVFFNEPFARLFTKFGTGTLGLRRPLYELGPKPLVGTVGELDEIMSLGQEMTARMSLNGAEGSPVVQIRRIPIDEGGSVGYVVTVITEVTWETMLERRGRRLDRCYEEVIELLGRVSALRYGADKKRVEQITGRAEKLVIALSQVESEWLKYEQRGHEVPWNK